MLESYSVALTTFFATIGPVDVAAMFAALAAGHAARERFAIAVRGVGIASVILVAFALLGQTVLDQLGISLAALRTAGGILLLLIGIDMVFARPSGATSATEEETREAEARADIAIFPLATPLIAGPGAMGAAILLMAEASGDIGRETMVLAALATILVATFAALLVATQLQRVLGVTGMHVVSRVMGVLLSALAVQFVFDGVAASGLFG